MSKRKDDENRILADKMAGITAGLTEVEVIGVFKGYLQGTGARRSELDMLAVGKPNLGGIILDALGRRIKQDDFQLLLMAQRAQGGSAAWLEEQVAVSLREAVDVFLEGTARRSDSPIL